MTDSDPSAEFVQAFKQRASALPMNQKLSAQESEMLYALAYQLVVQGNHEKAFSLFTLLVLCHPANVKYLRGLALLNRHLDRHREALMLLRFVDVLEPGNPQHAMDLAETLLRLKEFDHARVVLEETINRCQASSATEQVLRKATALHDLLQMRGANAAGT